MNTTASAEVLVRRRFRLESFVAFFGFASQFLIKSINKYLFNESMPDAILTSWLILIFGGSIPLSFVRFRLIQNKLGTYLDQSYKDNLLGEIQALQILNSPDAWSLHRRKAKLAFIGIFCFFSSLGGFVTTFIF